MVQGIQGKLSFCGNSLNNLIPEFVPEHIVDFGLVCLIQMKGSFLSYLFRIEWIPVGKVQYKWVLYVLFPFY